MVGPRQGILRARPRIGRQLEVFRTKKFIVLICNTYMSCTQKYWDLLSIVSIPIAAPAIAPYGKIHVFTCSLSSSAFCPLLN